MRYNKSMRKVLLLLFILLMIAVGIVAVNAKDNDQPAQPVTPTHVVKPTPKPEPTPEPTPVVPDTPPDDPNFQGK